MNILDIISKKRDKQELSKEEIEYFIEKYTCNEITDYQAAALIMAIYLNGMNKEETANFTMAMAHSGDVLNLSKLGTVVDKHSTGGVGDKVTIVMMPIIAALGVKVAKMSGRGLGYTGGTVDKLESIPGYNTNISEEQFIKNIENIGISLIGQTSNLAPADKKIYALRDSISCVENIPLIASSIMSKKIAAGAEKIVIDVTCGSGAFMKNIENATKLSNTMIEIGNMTKRQTICVITNMNEPIGYTIGNNLEIIEAINCLKGNIPEDIKEIILELGAYILKLANKGNNLEENKQKIEECINSKKAYNKFLELVKNQGGNIDYIEDTNKFDKAKYIIEVLSNKQGYVQELNAQKIGEIAKDLGAGRIKKEDNIDKTAGIILNKKVGDFVKEGEILAYIHTNKEDIIENAKERLFKTYKIDEKEVNKKQNILKVIE